MSAAQLGKTEIGLNFLGYLIHVAPGLCLFVMPTEDMARRTSRTRIDPMIAATPELAARVSEQRATGAGNNVLRKCFAHGELILTGANASSALRSTPVRYLICDEVDAWPHDVDGEGDPLSLAIARTATFRGKRKILMTSTPTQAGISRIERAFMEGDQRRLYVPCPHCGTYQKLEWGQVRWPEGDPSRAYLACQHCDGEIQERHKSAMLGALEWRATSPGDGRTASFHIPGLASPFVPWADIVRDYLAAKQSAERLTAWTNTSLGLPFDDSDTKPLEAARLQERAEECDPPWSEMLPDGVVVITAGVDVQNDRIEVETVGWGRNEESWSLDYSVLWGDPARPDVWADLDALLLRRFRHPRAVADLPVQAAAVDTGGHRTKEALEFCRSRAGRRVWPIKGRGGPGVPPWPKRPPKLRNGALAPIYIVGVDSLKSTLLARLSSEAKDGPGVAHFPADRDLDYFRGLCAERPVRKWYRGTPRIEWIVDKGVRNEPFDARVYASAALAGLTASGFKLTSAAERVEAAPVRVIAPGPVPVRIEAGQKPRPRVSRSKWLSA
jgi:phage terminase large subunit GpA-like protein